MVFDSSFPQTQSRGNIAVADDAPLVKRLDAASLVSPTRDQEDERRLVVALTQRGQELEADSRCLGQELRTRSGMEPKELIASNAQVQRLPQALARA